MDEACIKRSDCMVWCVVAVVGYYMYSYCVVRGSAGC